MGEFQRVMPQGDPNPKDDLQAELDTQNKDNKDTQDKPNDGTPAPAGDRPTWLPEKFKTPEDMAKAYTELEKKFTQDRQTDKKTDNTPPPDNQDKTKDAPKGLDWEGPVKELTDKGKISDETYNKFKEAGIPRDVVDRYSKQIVTEAEAENTQLYDRAGGKAVYEVMCDWAVANLPKAEAQALQKTIMEGELSQALIAVDALKSKYKAATGSDPKLIDGDNTQVGSVGYQSRAEMVRDMSDPKYAKDPAFRKQVEEKIKFAKFI